MFVFYKVPRDLAPGLLSFSCSALLTFSLFLPYSFFFCSALLYFSPTLHYSILIQICLTLFFFFFPFPNLIGTYPTSFFLIFFIYLLFAPSQFPSTFPVLPSLPPPLPFPLSSPFPTSPVSLFTLYHLHYSILCYLLSE